MAMTKKIIFSAIAALSLAAPLANAAPLSKLLPGLLLKDEQVKAAELDLQSADEDLKEARAALFPSVDLTWTQGREKQIKDDAGSSGNTNTNMWVYEGKVKVSQLLYDFGSTDSDVKTSRLSYDTSRTSLKSTRQSVMVTGLSSYLGLVKAARSAEYSRGLVQDIKKQVALEQSRKKRGSGFASDVLEAQAQLSSAQASLAQSDGALQNARNSFEKVFHVKPEKDTKQYQLPPYPTALLPKTVEQALQMAHETNTTLVNERNTVQTSKQSLRKSRANFAPKFELIGEGKSKKNMGGTQGPKQEYIAKVEVTYPLFAGGGDVAGLKSSEYKLQAAEDRFTQSQRTVDESVRNAWSKLESASRNANYLSQQVKTLKRFLGMARKERKQGRRSLLDVLISNTNYTSARTGLVAARADEISAGYSLLEAMGTLQLDSFLNTTGVKARPAIRKAVMKKVKPAATKKKSVKPIRAMKAGAAKARPAPKQNAAALQKARQRRMQQLQQQRMRMQQRQQQQQRKRPAAAAKKAKSS